MLFYYSYKWIVLAFLLISFQVTCKKNIEKKNINQTIFVKKINYYQKKNIFSRNAQKSLN